jgi:hypothetical protein
MKKYVAIDIIKMIIILGIGSLILYIDINNLEPYPKFESICPVLYGTCCMFMYYTIKDLMNDIKQ